MKCKNTRSSGKTPGVAPLLCRRGRHRLIVFSFVVVMIHEVRNRRQLR